MTDAMISRVDLAYCFYQTREKHKDNFLKIFHIPLSKRFFDNYLGLNSIAINDFLEPGEKENTYDAADRQYGEGAGKLLKDIVDDEIKFFEEVCKKANEKNSQLK